MTEIARGSRLGPNVRHGKRRGRRPKVPLMKEVESAYGRLHDLDWLQECSLAGLPEVRQLAQPRQFMPEAQALRGLLIQAARQVIEDIETVPSLAGVRLFLVKYLEGRRVSEVDRELGVSREWCSRHYRKEAFRMAGMQFVRLISIGR